MPSEMDHIRAVPPLERLGNGPSLMCRVALTSVLGCILIPLGLIARSRTVRHTSRDRSIHPRDLRIDRRSTSCKHIRSWMTTSMSACALIYLYFREGSGLTTLRLDSLRFFSKLSFPGSTAVSPCDH